jgi:hypothetical protein
MGVITLLGDGRARGNQPLPTCTVACPPVSRTPVDIPGLAPPSRWDGRGARTDNVAPQVGHAQYRHSMSGCLDRGLRPPLVVDHVDSSLLGAGAGSVDSDVPRRRVYILTTVF